MHVRVVDPLFEIALELKPRGSREMSRTLHHELRAAILDGRLAAGAKLRATRKSAAFFGVSRNTAAEVYERLVTEGHAVTRQGAGTYVAERAAPAAVGRIEAASAMLRLNKFWLRADATAAMSFWQDSRETSSGRKGLVDFRPAMVDSRLFPLDVFRRVSAKQLRGLERKPAIRNAADLRSAREGLGGAAGNDADSKRGCRIHSRASFDAPCPQDA
jgi:GntR family transcriptional regulator/MocR family aminotransferase